MGEDNGIEVLKRVTVSLHPAMPVVRVQGITLRAHVRAGNSLPRTYGH